jgi:NAD(P)-dependent dehydrogenase (short-subunit alcohol dehydrogenase family)
VEAIATQHGRLDGLIAAAGIQQETPALDYSAEDCNLMLGVNVTGCFMTAQAVAKQMIRFGKGGSIVMIASMSGTVANRVRSSLFPLPSSFTTLPPISSSFKKPNSQRGIGTHLPRLQRLQSGRHPTRAQPSLRMGRLRDPRQHHFPGLHRDGDGRGAV